VRELDRLFHEGGGAHVGSFRTSRFPVTRGEGEPPGLLAGNCSPGAVELSARAPKRRAAGPAANRWTVTPGFLLDPSSSTETT
jgi:hypothetical protein